MSPIMNAMSPAIGSADAPTFSIWSSTARPRKGTPGRSERAALSRERAPVRLRSPRLPRRPNAARPTAPTNSADIVLAVAAPEGGLDAGHELEDGLEPRELEHLAHAIAESGENEAA